MRKILCVYSIVFLGLFSFLNIAYAKNTNPMPPESKPYDIKKEHKKIRNLDKEKIGWVENVCIGDLSLKLKAKIDTGASTSSVNADIIKIVKRGDKRFVFYRIIDGDLKSDVIEAQLTRYTLIKPKLETSKKIRRPVVMTEFKIGRQKIREEVNLAQRDHFVYPLLIGRNVLRHNFMVDPAKKMTARTRCVSK